MTVVMFWCASFLLSSREWGRSAHRRNRSVAASIVGMYSYVRRVLFCALALLLCCGFAQRSEAATWSQFGESAGHISYVADAKITASNTSTMGVRWMANLFSSDLGSPVVAWNASLHRMVAYVGNERADLFALDAQTGAVLWSVNLGLNDALRATPAVAADGSVWAATHYNPTVYKIDGATGNVLCSNKAVLPIDASPTFASPPGGVPTVYFESVDSSTASGPVVALRASDCSRVFTFTKYRQIAGGWATPAYGVTSTKRALVLVGTADSDNTEYAIDAMTGALVWKYSIVSPPGDYDIGDAATVSPPGNNGFADGVVYVNSKYGVEYALDLTTGTKLWQTDLFSGNEQRDVRSSAALDGNSLVLGMEGGVDSLNATTGAILWRHANPLEVLSSVAIAGPAGSEVVSYGGIDGAFRVLALASGTLLYSYQSGGYITSSPAITSGTILMASSDGFLYSFAAGGSNSAPPASAVTFPANSSTVDNPNGNLTITGTAADPTGVKAVEIAVQSGGASGTWYNALTGQYGSAPSRNAAVLANPGAKTSAWSFAVPAPASGGGYEVFAGAINAGNVVARNATSSFAILPSRTEPKLKISSASTPPSGTFAVSARAFGIGETVQYTLFGKVVAAATAAPGTGHVPDVNITVPGDAVFGPVTLSAKGLSSGKVSSIVLDITNEWTQLGYGATRLDFEPNDTVILNSIGIGKDTVLNRAWYYATGSPVNASPAIVNGVAYIGDDSGTLTAIVTNTGAPKWTYVTPSHAPIRSSPAVDVAGNIFFGSSDGNLYEINAQGSLVRSITLGGHLGSPSVDDDGVAVGSDNKNVYFLSDSGGKILWMATLSKPVHSPPSYDAGARVVVVGDDSGAVTAFDASTGAQLWKVATDGSVTGAPAISNATVYVGSRDSNFYALDEKTGAQKWKFLADGPILAGAGVFVNGGDVSFGDQKGTLYLLTSAGALVYAQSASVHANSPIVGIALVEGNVLAETASGMVAITRLSGGTPATPWKYQTRAGLSTTPAIIDGAVYVSALDGGLYAFTPEGVNPVPANAPKSGPIVTITDAWTCTTP